MKQQPRIIVIAGPNGAGKTTFAREFLPHEAGCSVFLNADLIAAGLSPFAPEKAAIQAARLMLQAVAHHTARGETFAVETTLAGLGYARQIPTWRAAGFRVELHFLALPSADMAVQRVAERVRQGGHDIPEPVIRRRYAAGRRLLTSMYLPLVDRWAIYDNSGVAPVLLDCSPETTGLQDGAREPDAPYGAPAEDATQAGQVLAALDALRRAALRAHELARQTGTQIVLVREGRIVREPPPLDLQEAGPRRAAPITSR